MKNRRLYVWHLLSSSLFCLGTVVPVLSYAICHHNGHDQDRNRLAFRIMEGCSWTALALHILPEMVIDLNTFPKSARSHPHMRYGTKPFANFLQSILFAAACVFQGFFYCHVWSSDGDNEESLKSYQVIILIAGHVWLCSGLVTYVSGRWEGFQYDLSKPIPTILDQVANDTYTVTTILLCLAGYVMFVSTAVGSLLHALVRAVWAIMGTYHFSTDLRKMYLYITTRLVKSDGVNAPLRPSATDEDDDDDLDDEEMQQQQKQRRHGTRRQHSQSPTKERSPPRRSNSPNRPRRSNSPTKTRHSRGSSRGSSRDRNIRKAADEGGMADPYYGDHVQSDGADSTLRSTSSTEDDLDDEEIQQQQQQKQRRGTRRQHSQSPTEEERNRGSPSRPRRSNSPTRTRHSRGSSRQGSSREKNMRKAAEGGMADPYGDHVQSDGAASPFRPSSSTEDDLDEEIQQQQQKQRHGTRRQHSQSPTEDERNNPPRRGSSSPTTRPRRSNSPTPRHSRGSSRGSSREQRRRKTAAEMDDPSYDGDEGLP